MVSLWKNFDGRTSYYTYLLSNMDPKVIENLIKIVLEK